MELFSYFEETNDILVKVTPWFIAEESNFKDLFIYSYKVSIQNYSKKQIRLKKRRWLITDGAGVVEEVLGEGVVGKMPILGEGESFSYSSFCPLKTPTGNMRGSYFFETPEDGNLEVKIPLFFLREDIGGLASQAH